MPAMPFQSDDGKNWKAAADVQDAIDKELKAAREEVMKEIPNVILVALAGFFVGLYSSLQMWHGSHWKNLAEGPLCFVFFYGCYRTEKKATLWVLGTVAFFVVTAGAAKGAGQLDSYFKIFTPLFLYIALWQYRPFTALLVTSLIVGAIVWTVKLNRAPNSRIRVKLKDGSTGTIDEEDFDPRRVSTTLRHSGLEFSEYFRMSFVVC